MVKNLTPIDWLEKSFRSPGYTIVSRRGPFIDLFKHIQHTISPSHHLTIKNMRGQSCRAIPFSVHSLGANRARKKSKAPFAFLPNSCKFMVYVLHVCFAKRLPV